MRRSYIFVASMAATSRACSRTFGRLMREMLPDPSASYLSFVVSLFLFFCLVVDPSLAGNYDTMPLGRSLTGNQTLVSEGGKFEFGFFSPGSSHKYYVGIWYKMIPSKDVIWVANRKTPISDPSTWAILLSNDGNLVLFDRSKNLSVWSSNSTTSTSKAVVAVLLDTGNLVIREASNSSALIWQSFDHPSHTWMPGGWLGVNKITGEFESITSWKNPEDPSPGLFSESLHPDGSNQFVLLYNKSIVYASTGLWNGQFFNDVPGTKENSGWKFAFSDGKERKYATYSAPPDVIAYTFMHPSGQIRQMLWINSSQQWMPFYNQPLDLCDVYSVCGAFGICDRKNAPVCSCYAGFEPASKRAWDLGAWSSGCSRKTNFKCGKNSDGFFKMDMVRLPSDPLNPTVQSARECELACRSSCSCTAYAYDVRCSIWNGDLRHVKQLHDGDAGPAGILHIRLAASDIPPASSNNTTTKSTTNSLATWTLAVISVVVVVGVLAIGLGAVLFWTRRKRSNRISGKAGSSLLSFSYADLQRVTKNFSDKLGGGGFGSVFKGTLPDSTVIAVKKLEGTRQGEKQFRTEVSTLGSIQHVNLVRLRGFCCEGSNRLVVYDYMPGGSLDSHLFGGSKVLEWKTRYQIIIGVARGLAYLHDKCRECIIHCDIKPDNILLDEDLCPKVADFGMAKLIGHDFSKVLTTMRGTLGYLAPEWLSGLPVTPKVDVYSFGMMLFELISGKRNSNMGDNGSNYFFPLRAANQLVEDNLSSLLDERLGSEADMEELSRVCRIACWCIQDLDVNRPTMGQVVQILEGALDVNLPPIPRTLQNIMNDNASLCRYDLLPKANDDLEAQSCTFHNLPTETNSS